MRHDNWTTKIENLTPFEEMPVWARLKFEEMVRTTYYHSEVKDWRYARHANEAIISGFERFGDVIWIYFRLEWPDDSRIHSYIAPLVKDWGYKPNSYYSLTPITDPSAFAEKRDGRSYHRCDLPGHKHHVPFPYAHCYETGCWTWEQKYAY